MTEEFINVKQAAEKIGITVTRIAVLCREGRIEGAHKPGGRDWMIPTNFKISPAGRQRPGKIEVQHKK